MAVNIDLAPTFADVARTAPDYPVDGTSLMPILRGSFAGPWRKGFLIEHGGGAGVAPPFCACVRTDDGYVYVWYFTVGEEELYDLNGAMPGYPADPFELENRVSRAAYADIVADLHKMGPPALFAAAA